MNTYVLHVYLFYKCVETWYYHPVQKQGTLCNICIKSVYYVSGSVERHFVISLVWVWQIDCLL